MDAGGHSTIATDVLYSRSDTERRRVDWDRPDRWGRQLHWLLLGYGFRPWWALPWCFAVWLLGFVVLRSGVDVQPRDGSAPVTATEAAKPADGTGGVARWGGFGGIRRVTAARWPAGRAAVYSLDCLLPAMRLVEREGLPPTTRLQDTC